MFIVIKKIRFFFLFLVRQTKTTTTTTTTNPSFLLMTGGKIVRKHYCFQPINSVNKNKKRVDTEITTGMN